MLLRANPVLSALGLLFVCAGAHATAQELPARGSDLPTLQRPALSASSASELTDPIFAPDRRGSSVETLERLTGQAREGGSEAGRESERDEIQTDRDSFTPATTTAGRGKFILESAYSFIDNRGIKETHSFPEFLLRYGVTNRIELRLGWNAEIGGVGNSTSGVAAADEDPTPVGSRLLREYTMAYGVKVHVTKQDGFIPQSALIVQGFTPTGGNAGAATATQLVATYVAGWTFPNRWKLDTAIRYGTASEEGDRFNQWAPSVVLKVPMGEKFAAHIEYFGIFTTGKERNITQHYLSPGLHYLVTPNLEVGVRLGWGLNDQTSRFFSNVGLGWRF